MADTLWYAEAPAEQLDRLVAAWPDAPTMNTETLGMLLEIAAEQVWLFAPESLDVDNVPVDRPAEAPSRLVYAQLQQATNLWNAGRVNGNGEVGGEGFMYVPRPLDKTIRGIIRPILGVPDVG